MKKQVKLFAFAITLLIASFQNQSVFAQAGKKADRDTREWRYELECVGVGKEGTYLIKVSSYSKKSAVASEQCKKNAVHGVIFQGFAGGGQGCVPQKALTTNMALEQERADFFNDFFDDGGKYMKYVGFTNTGTDERVKIGKEWRVSVVVSVMKDNLRQDLEAAGIIKKLSSGF